MKGRIGVHLRNYEGNNKYMRKFISEISEELQIHPGLVWAAIYHFITWQWRSFHTCEFLEYTWDRCFVFKFFNRLDKCIRDNREDANRFIHLRRKRKIDETVIAAENQVVTEEDMRDITSVNPDDVYRQMSHVIKKHRDSQRELYAVLRKCILSSRKSDKGSTWNEKVILNLNEEELTELKRLVNKLKDQNGITKAIIN